MRIPIVSRGITHVLTEVCHIIPEKNTTLLGSGHRAGQEVLQVSQSRAPQEALHRTGRFERMTVEVSFRSQVAVELLCKSSLAVSQVNHGLWRSLKGFITGL